VDGDLRALCAELVAALSSYDEANPYHDNAELLRRANDLLKSYKKRDVDRLLSPGYESGAGVMDGAQLVDGEWYDPMFGCDSLQYVVDNIRNRASLSG
jgi:hypothetical protein